MTSPANTTLPSWQLKTSISVPAIAGVPFSGGCYFERRGNPMLATACSVDHQTVELRITLIGSDGQRADTARAEVIGETTMSLIDPASHPVPFAFEVTNPGQYTIHVGAYTVGSNGDSGKRVWANGSDFALEVIREDPET